LPSYAADRVTSALKKHDMARIIGSSLSFDGATGKDGATYCSWLVTTGRESSLVACTHAGANRATAERYALTARIILRDAPPDKESDDVTADDIFVFKGADHERLAKALRPLRVLGENVWACGSDNAANVQGALRILRDDDGLIDWGCQVHAFSNLALELGGLMHDSVVVPVSTIVGFFRSNRVFKELLKEECNRVLIPQCATRFLSFFLVIARLRAVKDTLIDVVRSTKFERLVSEARSEVKKDAKEVHDLIDEESTWDMVELAYDVLEPVVRAARMLDASSQFSVCLVYALWSMIPESFKIAMAKKKHRGIMRANHEFFESLADLAIDRWIRFDKPVFSAAFGLTPYWYAKVRQIKLADDDDFPVIKGHLRDVFRHMFRRFSPFDKQLRDEPLPESDPRVKDYAMLIENEFEDYLDGVGNWDGFKFETFLKTDPQRFWLNKAPQESALRVFAVRITSLDPVTSRAERMHKRFSASRTKTRSRLRRSVNQALAFLNDDFARETSQTSLGLAWDHLLVKMESFENVSDAQEKKLEDLVAGWIDAEDSELREEQSSPTEDLEEQLESSAAADDASTEEMPMDSEPALSPAPPPALSSRGRKRKAKTFGDDFVRLDDDGGL
jgi:hypothetical protein